MVPLPFYQKKSGFTLIELLVVISIIGLLFSITFASFIQTRNVAYAAKAAIDLNTIKIAITEYYNDNESWPYSGGSLSTAQGNWSTLGTLLQSYMKTAIPAPTFPSIKDNQNNISQGYVYYRGVPSSFAKVRIFNNSNGHFVKCILIGDGYYLDFLPPGEQNKITLGDNGIDPDGVDFLDGQYTLSNVSTDCD